MAIISNLNTIRSQIRPFKDEKLVWSYLNDALDPKSSTNKRISSLPIGSFEKFNITGEIYALEQVFYTKERKDCILESHLKYVDMQLLVSGNEEMELFNINYLDLQKEYDEYKDLLLYKLPPNISKINMQSSDISIFFKEDAHLGMSNSKINIVHKTVVKLPYEYLYV